MNAPDVFRPREGQRRILEYGGGLMGVAAVPGSGKTTTIAHLAAELLERRSRGEGPLPLITRATALAVLSSLPSESVKLTLTPGERVSVWRSSISRDLHSRALTTPV